MFTISENHNQNEAEASKSKYYQKRESAIDKSIMHRAYDDTIFERKEYNS